MSRKPRYPSNVYTPYTLRPAPPQLAILRRDATIVDEHGERIKPHRIPKGVQVWAAQERVLALLRERNGSALCWRGQPIRYCLRSKYDIRILALPFPSDDERALRGLGAWRDWLAGAGASPLGTLGSSSMSLLRATLDAPLWTSVPFASCPPIRFTLGGRQELGPAGAPAEHAGVLRHFDMRAAYPRTLARLEYGGHWFRLHERKLEEHAELIDRGGRMVFCRARVRLAGEWPGPLVKRPRAEPDMLGFEPAYPRRGTMQGLWTYPELRAAREHGATVKLLDGWFHTSGQWRPFERWWREVEQGREMDGFAGLLAKATGSALWGQFCVSRRGRRQLMFYNSKGRKVIKELTTSGGRRPAHDLAEYLTGSVRAELYRFLVAAGGRLCSAHTDGGWVDCRDGWSYPDWRSKEQAVRLRVLDPQLLAYRRPGDEEDSYVVSGWPAEGAAELFEDKWAERTEAVAA